VDVHGTLCDYIATRQPPHGS